MPRGSRTLLLSAVDAATLAILAAQHQRPDVEYRVPAYVVMYRKHSGKWTFGIRYGKEAHIAAELPSTTRKLIERGFLQAPAGMSALPDEVVLSITTAGLSALAAWQADRDARGRSEAY